MAGRDFSSIGSASMSARIASTGPGRPPSISPTTPVLPTPVWWLIPSRVNSRAHDAGGAHLLEAKFRMGVYVAADLDQSCLDAWVASRIAVVGSLARDIGQFPVGCWGTMVRTRRR